MQFLTKKLLAIILSVSVTAGCAYGVYVMVTNDTEQQESLKNVDEGNKQSQSEKQDEEEPNVEEKNTEEETQNATNEVEETTNTDTTNNNFTNNTNNTTNNNNNNTNTGNNSNTGNNGNENTENNGNTGNGNEESKFVTPNVTFSKNGDTELKLSQNITLEFTGDYIPGQVYYLIDDQNITIPDNSKAWKKYNDKINISDVDGEVYIWVKMNAKDGKAYNKCSKSFNMKSSWIIPTVTFTKNGDAIENVANSTKVNVSGDYITEEIYYILDTQNTLAPSDEENWVKYNGNIDISGYDGNVYVWVKVYAKDGNIYNKCSNAFNMKSAWVIPTVTFTQNGDSEQKTENSTQVSITGDYVSGEIYYVLDNQNVNVPDENSSWTKYNNGISISKLDGNVYVWIGVLKKDGTYHYECSNAFNMKADWETPEIEFTLDGNNTASPINTTKINVTGDYTEVRYYISSQDTITLDNVENWTIYNTDDEITIIGENVAEDKYVWVAVLGKDEAYYEKCSNVFKMSVIPQINQSGVDINDFKSTNSFNPLIPGFYYKVNFTFTVDIDYVEKVEYYYTTGNSTEPTGVIPYVEFNETQYSEMATTGITSNINSDTTDTHFYLLVKVTDKFGNVEVIKLTRQLF